MQFLYFTIIEWLHVAHGILKDKYMMKVSLIYLMWKFGHLKLATFLNSIIIFIWREICNIGTCCVNIRFKIREVLFLDTGVIFTRGRSWRNFRLWNFPEKWKIMVILNKIIKFTTNMCSSSVRAPCNGPRLLWACLNNRRV